MGFHIFRPSGLGTVFRYRPVSERSAFGTGKAMVRGLRRETPKLFNKEIESVEFQAPEAGTWVLEIEYILGHLHNRREFAHTCALEITIEAQQKSSP